MTANVSQSRRASTRRTAELAMFGVGGLGLLLAFALEADVALESGIWYPVIYAGAPAIAAVAAFVRVRPTVGRLRLAGIGAWLLLGSVLALAVTVVLALGYPPDRPRTPEFAVLSAALLYAGFLVVPVALASAAAERRGIRTGLLLALAPVGQSVVAAALVVGL